MSEPKPVVIVPRENAERLRKHLRTECLLDVARKITTRDGEVVLPVVSRLVANVKDFGARVAYDERPVERAVKPGPFDLIAEAVDIDADLKGLLPRKWEKLGDVLVLRLSQELASQRVKIAEAYAKVLGAKAVLQEVSGIEGEWRLPRVEKIWGGDTETVHVEGGVRFKLDPAKVMFSSGNLPERIRMGRICAPGETVVDMFAGIGYFTIPIAVHSRPRRVFACEVNPTAFNYLEENIRINRVDTVTALLGDCLGTAPGGTADRVIMGYLRAQEYLPKAFEVLKSEGVLHYHETCPNELVDTRPWSTVREAADEAGREVGLLRHHRLKSYAPGVSHVVLDVEVSMRSAKDL